MQHREGFIQISQFFPDYNCPNSEFQRLLSSLNIFGKYLLRYEDSPVAAVVFNMIREPTSSWDSSMSGPYTSTLSAKAPLALYIVIQQSSCVIDQRKLFGSLTVTLLSFQHLFIPSISFTALKLKVTIFFLKLLIPKITQHLQIRIYPTIILVHIIISHPGPRIRYSESQSSVLTQGQPNQSYAKPKLCHIGH